MMLIGLLLAASGPVYLDCQLNVDGKEQGVSITVDEQSGKATVRLPTGRVTMNDAAFEATTVTIPDHPVKWVVNRVTLGLTRNWPTLGTDANETGKCQRAKPPADRAF